MAGSTAVTIGPYSPQLQKDILTAPSGVIADIIGVAQGLAKKNGLTAGQTSDLISTSLATAAVETGGTYNPKATGDNGTSFGEFQLHEGGELNNLPGSLSQQETEAFNPVTNATVAIQQIINTIKANAPAFDQNAGNVAAAAQRPQDAQGYATDIDQLLANQLTGTVGQGRSVIGSSTGADTVNVPDNITPANLASGSASGTGSTSGTTSDSGLLVKVGVFIIGAILLGVGLKILFPATTTDVVKTAAAT